MYKAKDFGILTILVILVSFGVSLTLKAAVGVGAWDALAQSGSFLTGVQVGTVGMVLNISCIFGQLLVMKKDFDLKRLLQLPISILLGVLVNYFFYTVLAPFEFNNYIMRLIIFTLALSIVAFAVGAVMVLDIVTFPVEGFCMVLANKLPVKFGLLRQLVDIISIIVVVVLTYVFSIPLTLGVGTFIGMFIFGPMMGFFIERTTPLLRPEGVQV